MARTQPRVRPRRRARARTSQEIAQLERFDPEQFRVRENPSDLIVPFEHDDEHETISAKAL
jgi:hypothetical protein